MPDTHTLAPWARDIISAVPKRGEGLNRWLMSASVALRSQGRSGPEITRELEVLTADEAIRAGEIERAVKRSADYIKAGGSPRKPVSKWPAVNTSARAKVIAQHDGGAVELWELTVSVR